MKNKLSDAIWGHCVGDALGLPVEFSSRAILRTSPVTGPRAFGTFHQPAGTWSDDSSMSLCLLESLNRGLDYKDIMSNFSAWLNRGEFTPYGETFDFGRSTQEAIRHFDWGIEPLRCGGTSEYDNGNGALMRILPALFFLRAEYGQSFFGKDKAMDVLHNLVRLTHGHPRSMVACGIYLAIANELCVGQPIEPAVSEGIERAWAYYSEQPVFARELLHYSRIRSSSFALLDENMINNSGYVVDTIEAAIWSLLTTRSYRECILRAVNLGDDTDSVAAVVGGLAGMAYGRKSIPVSWANIIARSSWIDELCVASSF